MLVQVKALAFLFAMTLTALAAPRIEVHGHRGARAVRPENTLPAFEYAIETGVDVLELDLGVTRDDVVVVSHDPHVNAAICKGPHAGKAIRSLTLAEVRTSDCGGSANPDFPRQQLVPGAKMPTLDEVFALAPRGKFHFNIETKISPATPELAPTPERFAELVLGLIRKHKLESRVIVQSFDYRTLRAMRKIEPEIRLAALFGPEGSDDFRQAAIDSGAGILSPHYSLVTRERVSLARWREHEVVPWTANDPATWERLAEAQVDGIITDDPAALIAWLKERKLR